MEPKPPRTAAAKTDSSSRVPVIGSTVEFEGDEHAAQPAKAHRKANSKVGDTDGLHALEPGEVGIVGDRAHRPPEASETERRP